MKFLDGNVSLGSAGLSNGTATLPTSALSAGNHSIVAQYTGNAVYKGSISVTLTQVVKAFTKSNTTTTLTAKTLPGGIERRCYDFAIGRDRHGTIFDNGGLLKTATWNQPLVGGAEVTGAAHPSRF